MPAQTLHYAITPSSLTYTLYARSKKGLCAIFLGDSSVAMKRELRKRFPGSTLIEDRAALKSIETQIVGLMNAPEKGLDLTLDLQGTSFQQRVWKALQTIPAGSTASYADIARRIGSPRSVRAVAGACAANRLAVVIPCHRVVRKDGDLSGYRWGVELKRTLLKREALQAATSSSAEPAAISR